MSVSKHVRAGVNPERGQVVVIFALLVPVLLALSGFVIGIGNWYTHGKHLQTKADAGAFAGGTGWAFPCGTNVDARIEALARLYAGSTNPQVGGVPDANIHSVLNGTAWYDDDSNPAPIEKNDPLNASICDAKILDVKVTEDNSFPLASLIPLFPDIKRKARVELQEAEAVSDLLPISVRVPKPSAAAAVFYDETDGSIFDVRYFNDATVTGLPPTAGLGGMSTLAAGYAPVNLQAGDRVAVAIAMSFRRACNTFDAGHPQPTGLLTGPAPCFEDGYGPGVPGYANVNDFCNQPPSSGTQLVDCFYSTGTPTQTMRRGLHFIRGYGNASVTNGRPAVQSAYLSDVIASPCVGTSYFNSERTNSCAAQLNVAVDIGDLIEDIDVGPGVNMQQTRTALTLSNIEVRYKLVRDDGTTFCDFGDTCNLKPQGNGPGDVTFSTDGTTGANGAPHLPLRQASRGMPSPSRFVCREARSTRARGAAASTRASTTTAGGSTRRLR